MTNHLPDICYKRNYLVSVVARIDFLDAAKCLSEKILPEPIQSAIRNRYEIYEPSTARVQGLEITDKGVSMQHEEFQQWTYHGSEREKTINLSKKKVDITLKRYENYDEFKLDVLDPIKSIQDAEGDSYVAHRIAIHKHFFRVAQFHYGNPGLLHSNAIWPVQ